MELILLNKQLELTVCDKREKFVKLYEATVQEILTVFGREINVKFPIFYLFNNFHVIYSKSLPLTVNKLFIQSPLFVIS